MKVTMKRRVENGAQALDQRWPGWEQRINLEKMDIGSSKRCPLGQLEGDFRKGFLLLVRDDRFSGIGAHDHGFVATSFVSDDAEWEALTEAWKKAIQQRLRAA